MQSRCTIRVPAGAVFAMKAWTRTSPRRCEMSGAPTTIADTTRPCFPICLLNCSKERSLRVDVSCMEKISTAVTSARPPPPGGCLGRPAGHELLPERRLVLPLHLEDVHAAVLALDLDVCVVGVRRFRAVDLSRREAGDPFHGSPPPWGGPHLTARLYVYASAAVVAVDRFSKTSKVRSCASLCGRLIQYGSHVESWCGIGPPTGVPRDGPIDGCG